MKKISFFCALLVVVLVVGCRKDDHISTAPWPTVQLDTTNPVITINSSDSISHTLNASFTLPSATASDYQDGDLTALISIFSNVNENVTGNYFVRYYVMDSDSNLTADTIFVSVVNSAAGIAGLYSNCRDTCQVSGPMLYAATVSVSTTTNGGIVINNFGAFGSSVNVVGYVSGSTISLPGQSIGTGGTLLAASGSIVSTNPYAFTISYVWTDGTSTETCISHYSQ